MGRWPADARERLEDAAFELFAARGYDVTTVTEIAERAGLNRATFFRHFADKREVLFGGEDRLAQTLVEGIRRTDASPSMCDALRQAFEGVDPLLTERQRARSRQRVAALASSVEVQERGLLKRSRMTTSIREALTEVGFDALDARLGAELAMLTFSIAMEAWLTMVGDARPFSANAAEALQTLAERIERLS